MIKKQFITMLLVVLAPLSLLADESTPYSTEMQQQLQSMSSEERRLFRSMNGGNRSSESEPMRNGNSGSEEKKRYRHREAGKSLESRDSAQSGNSGGYGRGYGSRR